MFTIDKLSNARRLAHVHSPGGDGGFDRVRKDIFEIGLLSPPQDNQRDNGWGTREVAPLLLTSSTVSFASVMDVSPP